MPNGCTNGVKNGVNHNETPQISWNPKIDVWWHEVMNTADDQCEPVWVDAEDPLFILYTR
jgi:putative uncharacterized protein (fragment)